MIIFIAVKSFIFQNYFVPVAGVLYPDSVVGTDSHTTMINGLGVVGWGVGGGGEELFGYPVEGGGGAMGCVGGGGARTCGK